MFDERKKNHREPVQGNGARRSSSPDCSQRHGASPLQWWRADCRPHLDAAAIVELRTALSKLHLFAHPTWPAAVAGNASAVVRIAMTIRYDLTSPTWRVDCAGSLALLSAAEGSETATAVLHHFRERYVVPKRCRTRRSA
jgi:hypothetical protein